MAAMKAAAPDSIPSRCPATAMSTIPTRGTVMLASMLGRASLRISLFIYLYLPSLMSSSIPR